MEAKGVKLTQVEVASGIAYPNLNATVNSGKTGKPTQPKEETMKKLVPALLQLDLIEEESEAWIAAGYEVEGFTVVREDASHYLAKGEAVPVEYEPILDELRSARYDGGLDTGDVDEITEIIRMKARRRAERQGRA